VETPDIQPIPWLPGPDGIEQHCWQQFLSGSPDARAALDVRLRGAHGLTFRDVLVLELLSGPDRRAHRIHALAQALGVSPSQLASQVRRLEGRGLITRSPTKRDPRGILPRITGEGHMRLYAIRETYGRGPVHAASRTSLTSKRDT
jgi:DNA-binding MarR family transcriptional regulator